MGKNKNIFLFFLIIIWLANKISIAQSNIIVVSNAPNVQYQADIDGDYIVYFSNQDGYHHIYLYKISDSSTTRITSFNNSSKWYPKISGNYIVWTESRSGDFDIYYYDLNQPQLGDQPLLQKSGNQYTYDLDGENLLYYDQQGSFPNTNYKLICYNILTSSETVVKADVVASASISGHLIVYEYNSDIYLYNLFTHTTEVICDDPAEQHNPCISGGPFRWKIVWEDNRNGDWDIYQCNLFYWQSGAHLLDFPVSFIGWERYNSERSNQRSPHIKNNMLVFTDDLSGNDEIYLMNYVNPLIGPVIRISFSNYKNCQPVTDGNNIVWWDDKDSDPYLISESDVYLWKKPPGADLAVSGNLAKRKLQIYEPINLSLFVSNFGPSAATNVVFSDTISNRIQILSASSDAGNITISPDNIVTFTIDNLPADSSVTITITGIAQSFGKAKIYGSVSSNQPDFVSSNNRINLELDITDSRSFSLDFLQSGTNPKIKVDNNGFLHIISFTEFPILLTYATNKTGNWTQDIIDNSQGDLFLKGADLDVDEQGNAHVVYVISPYGPNYPNQTLYYTNNSSGQWQSTLPLGPVGGTMELPKIRIDINNKVHIAFISNIWGGSIYYLNNVSGDWSSPEFIAQGYNSFSMDVDKNNFLHFAAYNINSGPFYITNSPDNTWHSPEIIDQAWTGGQKETLSLDLVVDSSNTPHISYVGNYINNEDYKYAVKLNNNWQNYFVDSCGFMGGFNALAVDKNEVPYVIYATPSSHELRYAKKEGNNFVPRLIESGFNDYLGNLFDIDSDQSNNIHFVYFKNGLYYGTNAPYIISFGGGDDNTGGYFFANSVSSGAPSHPDYYWLDPIAFGHSEITNWSAGNADDGYFGPLSLPFNFMFFTSLYNEVFINSNGYLSFLSGYSLTASNANIPNLSEPNNIIAACAMDLNLDNSLHPDSKIYYGNVGEKFVVTFYHAHTKSSPSDYITFQIVLHNNGNILFQYNDLESTYPLAGSIANDALIGIENEIGTKGICYRNNGVGGPIFSSPLAVMFGKNSLILPVNDEQLNIPTQFILYQNYPNPFNPSTTISWQSPVSGWQTIKLFDVLGIEIETIVDGYYEAGSHSTLYIVNSTLSSGVYFYQLKVFDTETGSGQVFMQTKKMMLIK